MSSVVTDYVNTLLRTSLIKEIRIELLGFEENELMKKAIEDSLNVLNTMVASTVSAQIREKYMKDLEDRMDTWIQIMACTDPPEVYGLLKNFSAEVEDLKVETNRVTNNKQMKQHFGGMHSLAQQLYKFLCIYFLRDD